MIRQSRCLLLLMVLTTVGLAWPSDVAAQRRPPSAPHTGVAVPRTYASGYHRPVLRPAVTTTPGTPILIITTRTIQGSVLDLVSDSAGPGRIGARGGIRTPTPRHIPIRPRMRTLIRYYAYDNTGSARLLITPRNAQVYVDGQFLGLVGEFDGSRQRLTVPTGAHEVQVYLEGYRSLTQKVLFTRGTTLRIESALQPLAPGEPSEPKPAPRAATLRTDPYQSHTQAAPHLYG